MKTMTANELQSFRPYHPGELLKEELECREIKQKDFGLNYLKFSKIYKYLNLELEKHLNQEYLDRVLHRVYL